MALGWFSLLGQGSITAKPFLLIALHTYSALLRVAPEADVTSSILGHFFRKTVYNSATL